MIEQVKENIKNQIKERKTTTGKVCSVMKKDRKYINRITDNVALHKIINIAHAIGCEPGELLKGL